MTSRGTACRQVSDSVSPSEPTEQAQTDHAVTLADILVEFRAPGISKEQEAEADIPSFVLFVQMWGLSSETGI